MEKLPVIIPVLFILTTLLTVFLFYKASGRSKPTLAIITAWLLIQTIIGLSGFYEVTETIPPRFGLLLLPPLATIAFLFTTSGGRNYLDGLNTTTLTLLHIVRIPVEVVLFWLFLYRLVPGLMTFEGRNLDILSGLTAPFIFYFGYIKNKLNNTVLLIWNLACLALLINVVTHAVLSFPSPFQQLAFDQPNTGVLHFPFIWLPGAVVPLVLLSHLASIRQLVYRQKRV